MPRELQQRVLLIGVAGALVLRGVFIALGAQLIASFSWAFLLFGAVLLVTAVKVLRDALSPDDHTVDIGSIRVRAAAASRHAGDASRMPGPGSPCAQAGRRALTPLALVIVAILGTDVVFAIDSVPAVYGITGDPYLVFATNAFALLGLRALYFVVEGALGSLRHLGHGLAAILAFIGVKLVLHWAHGAWPFVPEVPTLASLGVIVGILGARDHDEHPGQPSRRASRVDRAEPRTESAARQVPERDAGPGLTGGRMAEGPGPLSTRPLTSTVLRWRDPCPANAASRPGGHVAGSPAPDVVRGRALVGPTPHHVSVATSCSSLELEERREGGPVLRGHRDPVAGAGGLGRLPVLDELAARGVVPEEVPPVDVTSISSSVRGGVAVDLRLDEGLHRRGARELGAHRRTPRTSAAPSSRP